MPNPLRAVVVGAGWAGEGHTKALQWCDVEVAAICGRDGAVVQRVAGRLGVAEASTDWRAVIERLRPDIVTLATPAPLRREVVDVAAALRCHLLCEKPLALTAKDAGAMYRSVEAAGVKHAYAATQRYGAEIAWLAELVREGAIGELTEVVGVFRSQPAPVSPVRPWVWMADVRAGGGRLFNGFTHDLAILSRILAGPPLRVMGRVQSSRHEAAVVPGIHDIRQAGAVLKAVTAEYAATLPRRSVEGEDGFSAIMEFAGPSHAIPVTMTLGQGFALPGEVDGWRLYGRTGTLLAQREGGRFSYTVSRLSPGEQAMQPLPVPERLLATLPQVGDDEQNKWCALFRDFVAAIRGEP
ncbi:MAG TPA: Gfo/Idh/MocA family oxidoreductase, partial [Chloroflexota bacterium]|nr:Gfo/Idh/MocA family oxidoreductase [Chloroflexota bacterium]